MSKTCIYHQKTEDDYKRVCSLKKQDANTGHEPRFPCKYQLLKFGMRESRKNFSCLHPQIDG